MAREGEWGGLAVSAQVEREFRRYLGCSILAHGFARAWCDLGCCAGLVAAAYILDPGADDRAGLEPLLWCDHKFPTW